ncbi:hypothetical protein [Algoriphagus chordae]|uniref:DUF1772 domain-containing protein n=1 Tax=Algoriphagus chordae TaxID=237019 RepID=A0A2W7R5K8_9BACT|nr:hypothetical protein [Algoriphagus chordae]PZX55764.1 hypothetical protein LV85_00989 [Algoriphagus chordae]
MKTFGKLTYILLIGLTFMQAGASLFAITVNVSTLIESPPASLVSAQGPYAFNPDLFWEKFPTLVLITLLLALVFNWKSSLRKWVLAGGLVWILSGLVVFILLSPAQTEFLSTEFTNTVDQELIALGKTWRNYSLLFMSLSALSGFIYLSGLFSNNKQNR